MNTEQLISDLKNKATVYAIRRELNKDTIKLLDSFIEFYRLCKIQEETEL